MAAVKVMRTSNNDDDNVTTLLRDNSMTPTRTRTRKMTAVVAVPLISRFAVPRHRHRRRRCFRCNPYP
jgi:hypothetical protein